MQALIAAIARLVREMPRNPFVIDVDQALKDALASQSNAAPANSKTAKAGSKTKRQAKPKA